MTTLEAKGPGSLQEAPCLKRPGIVLFEVGGYPNPKEMRMTFLPEMWLLDSMTPVPPAPAK